MARDMFSLLWKWQRAETEVKAADEACDAAAKRRTAAFAAESEARLLVEAAMEKHFPGKRIEHQGFAYWLDKEDGLCWDETSNTIASVSATLPDGNEDEADAPETPLAEVLQASIDLEERKAAHTANALGMVERAMRGGA